MNKIIFDCDNTMGIPGKDVDDGLALLYLLGRNDVNILGITTTYGNSDIETVYENTLNMASELHINIPIYKGAENHRHRQSSATSFLVQKVKEFPGEITLLATGSLTNLLGAQEVYSEFFKNLKQIILMGGITEPLIINGKNLNELNFSCDPLASYKVLSSNCKVTVLTGHICLQAFFGEKEFNRLKKNSSNIYNYINTKANPWYEFVMNSFGIKGFYNWDIVPAVYITNPELFEDSIKCIVSTTTDLENGYLKIDNNELSYKVNIPNKITDIDKFNEIIFESWDNVKI